MGRGCCRHRHGEGDEPGHGMGHGPGYRHAAWWHLAQRSCCRGPFGLRRHFVSRQERLEMLQHYLEELRAEAKAVEEYIEELRGGKPEQSGQPA